MKSYNHGYHIDMKGHLDEILSIISCSEQGSKQSWLVRFMSRQVWTFPRMSIPKFIWEILFDCVCLITFGWLFFFFFSSLYWIWISFFTRIYLLLYLALHIQEECNSQVRYTFSVRQWHTEIQSPYSLFVPRLNIPSSPCLSSLCHMLQSTD